MKILQGRVKAAETAHFKPEMEDQILRRRDQLIKEGRIQNLTMPSGPVRSSVDTLPEILSHDLPLNLKSQRQQFVNSKGYTVARPAQSQIAKFANDWQRPSIYDGLGSKQLKASRDKWAHHTLDGKSIFDVNAAQDFMLSESNRKSAEKKSTAGQHWGQTPSSTRATRRRGSAPRAARTNTRASSSVGNCACCLGWLSDCVVHVQQVGDQVDE